MTREEFRACSFDGLPVKPTAIPKEISEKVIKTEENTFIIFASSDMIKAFKEQPTVLFMDSTHGTNSSKYPLISFLVTDKRGEGVPVIQIVANTEASIVVKQGLVVLNRLAEEAVHYVKVIMSDVAASFINAWREAFPSLPSGKSDGWNYFVNDYGPNGKVCKPKEWARCFNHGILSHNLIEERALKNERQLYYRVLIVHQS
ncbi:hypothetical protein TCAL_16925 [Tigriopus californicus]|uniref:ZSWIM1/3 RNaseH-like domain-containing protein n=1 Tax=Tigriopus californicus TaxID=6832 RepID=A0A553NQN4_TIGCA|nr:hypothetical protein TCAL_16925 [Tigriopus californicus]